MADPDPTFHANADPAPNLLARERKKISSKSLKKFQTLTKLVMCNFLSNNAGGGVTDEGQGKRYI